MRNHAQEIRKGHTVTLVPEKAPTAFHNLRGCWKVFGVENKKGRRRVIINGSGRDSLKLPITWFQRVTVKQ